MPSFCSNYYYALALLCELTEVAVKSSTYTAKETSVEYTLTLLSSGKSVVCVLGVQTNNCCNQNSVIPKCII